MPQDLEEAGLAETLSLEGLCLLCEIRARSVFSFSSSAVPRFAVYVDMYVDADVDIYRSIDRQTVR